MKGNKASAYNTSGKDATGSKGDFGLGDFISQWFDNNVTDPAEYWTPRIIAGGAVIAAIILFK